MRIRIFWIRISILKVGSGSVCRDTNPDPDPGNMQKHAMAKHSNCFLNLDLFFSLDPYGEFPDPDLNPQGDSRIQDPILRPIAQAFIIRASVRSYSGYLFLAVKLFLPATSESYATPTPHTSLSLAAATSPENRIYLYLCPGIF